MGLGGRNLQTHSQQTGDQPSPAAQQPPTPGQVPDTIGHQASDEVLAIRSKFRRQQRFPTTWQHLKIGDRYQPKGKGNADNHTYVVSSNTLGCLEQAPGTRQQQLAQHANGNNAGGGESVTQAGRNIAVALASLAAAAVLIYVLAVLGGIAPLNQNIVPGAPANNGVTIEQISTAVNDGIKPLASAVSDNTASIADLREDQQDLKNRVDDLAAIRGGTAATPAPPNLYQVDCTEPGESGSTYTVGWMYRDAIGCPWFIVLEVDDNTGEILKYDWLPDSCVPVDSKDMGHEPDNYPDCTNVPTPTPAATPVNPPDYGAQCPDVGEASLLITHNETGLVREGGRNPGEEPCLFEWRNDLAPSDTIWCPDGWACELDTIGAHGYYYFGGGGSYQIDAGSFRLIAAYPDGDPIHDPCSALANSRDFLQFSGEPAASWNLFPGNFDCPGEAGHGDPGYAPDDSGTGWVDPGMQPGAGNPGNGQGNGGQKADRCPSTSRGVARLVGGNKNYWTRFGPRRWRYGLPTKLAPNATLTAPRGWGSIDVDSAIGTRAARDGKLMNGESATVVIATFNCDR